MSVRLATATSAHDSGSKEKKVVPSMTTATCLDPYVLKDALSLEGYNSHTCAIVNELDLGKGNKRAKGVQRRLGRKQGYVLNLIAREGLRLGLGAN